MSYIASQKLLWNENSGSGICPFNDFWPFFRSKGLPAKKIKELEDFKTRRL